MTTRPNDPRLYVTTQEGAIYVVDNDGKGNTTANFFFDAVSSISLATGRTLYGSGGQDGLQSIAFHPDFDNPSSPGYGKFYTTLMESRPASTVGHHYLGDSTSGDNKRTASSWSGPSISILAKWTINSYREVFRCALAGR